MVRAGIGRWGGDQGRAEKTALSVLVVLCILIVAACARTTPTPLPTLPLESVNLDSETQRLVEQAERVAFVIPFSHWDTDWHDSYPNYVKRSDGNILAAIQMAKQDPRFRYTFEQVLFVQHFWETYPEHREDLQGLVQQRQLTFAWAGITQPETSLAAPAVQVRNLQLGQQWIAETFGPEHVPPTAWQSDAFGNSAAFPLFLNQSGIQYLFIGRSQYRCDPDSDDCQPLPHTFYWKSPAVEARVLVTYLSYPGAWDAIHRLPDEAEQVKALRDYTEEQFERTGSKYAFIPMGSDFIDPLPNLMSLVDTWNAADRETVLVVADPLTAFQYIARQDVPEFAVDLNPIWQAFYGTHPAAKIADKESEYYLTTADKFGVLIDAPQSSAWLTASMNAHYDNIGAVSFDWVWEGAQRPRFEQTVRTAAEDLSNVLTQIASGVEAPLIVFNPSSWPRSEVIELQGQLPDVSGLTAQAIGAEHAAVYAANIPAIGFSTLDRAAVSYPARLSQNDGRLTLSNGLVSVTLDAAHGGAFSNLQSVNASNLLTSFGDDLTYWDDAGDVYGAFFEGVRARESDVPAQLAALAEGPLLARAQATFTLGGFPLTKTVTLRADSPLVEVTLDIRALPETSAVAHTPTTLDAQNRADDLGFAAFTHPIDTRPIAPGDITYRRKIFYPVTYWSDIAVGDAGLALVTHGLQGVAGTGALNLLLVRSVTKDEHQEGVSDTGYHLLRYAYWPHAGENPEVWRTAYAFNQPLIPVWRLGEEINVQLPFTDSRQVAATSAQSFPTSFSLLSAESGLVADVYEQNGEMMVVTLDYDPATPVTLRVGARQISGITGGLAHVPIPLR
jgi:hypothetical protein